MRYPYIGITGVATPFEATAILDMTPPDVKRKIGIGVLVSEKKMLEGMFTHSHPHWGEVERICTPDTRAFNIIHYIPLHYHHTHDALYVGLMKMVEIGGAHLHAIQINMDWPSESAIAQFRSRFPHIQIIMQIRRAMLDAFDEPPSLMKRIKDYYDGLVDYFLVDRSMGEGKPFDIHEAEKYLLALASAFPLCGLVLAGGLYAEVLEKSVRYFAMRISYLSIDAQTHLQDAHRIIEYMRVKKYIRQALQIFNEFP